MESTKLITALENFLESYNALTRQWGMTDHPEILDDNYPFEKSFDELEIVEWVEKAIEKLKILNQNK
ncbi:hypothetical protein [Chryseobacterium defluvii]|nr:hypothetical protein [Chryseobacterium defluvii]